MASDTYRLVDRESGWAHAEVVGGGARCLVCGQGSGSQWKDDGQIVDWLAEHAKEPSEAHLKAIIAWRETKSQRP